MRGFAVPIGADHLQAKAHVRAQAVFVGNLVKIFEDRGTIGDRLFMLPRGEGKAQGVHIAVRTDAGITEQVPGATQLIAPVQNRIALVRAFLGQVHGHADAGNAGADDQKIKHFLNRGHRVHKSGLPPAIDMRVSINRPLNPSEAALPASCAFQRYRKPQAATATTRANRVQWQAVRIGVVMRIFYRLHVLLFLYRHWRWHLAGRPPNQQRSMGILQSRGEQNMPFNRRLAIAVALAFPLASCGGSAAIQPDRSVFGLDNSYQRYAYDQPIEATFDTAVAVFREAGYRLDVVDRATGQISGQRGPTGDKGTSTDKELKFYALVMPHERGSQLSLRIVQIVGGGPLGGAKAELILSEPQLYQYAFVTIANRANQPSKR